ncbi:integrase [Escherichia coli]|nr:integrase [Escherichia coli]EEW2090070.1 integrase [Escherichia coli]EFD5376727.1 integrase [Escherichia coli]MDN0580398.1 integrase [Escherichia coli]
MARDKGRNNNDQKEPQANERVHSSWEQSEDKTCYRVYGSWMAENNQDQVSILNQKLSEFAPSMPHAVRSDVINNRLHNLHLHAHHFLIRRYQLITHLNPHLHRN